MSYSVTLRTEGGQTTVAKVTGDVPDGEHQIDGHEDAGYLGISVTRRTPDGRYATSAQHQHTKEH